MSNNVWEFEHSVDCAASRSFVWNFWTDVANWERIEGEAVEWIRLDGPFAVGTQGTTKSRGQEPMNWVISQLTPETSATIEMRLETAVFRNQLRLDPLADDRTRITQQMSLEGESPADLVASMRTFESTAPQGLTKLASSIEAAHRRSNE